MAIGVRPERTAGAPLRCRPAGNALLIHPKGGPDPQALAFAAGLAADHQHTLVVVDLPFGALDDAGERIARLLASHPGSLRLVFGRATPQQARAAGQQIADRLDRLVLAPDGEVLPTAGGGLFIPADHGSGWLRLRPGRPPERDSPRFPKPMWEFSTLDRPWATSPHGVVEAVPSGVWVRSAHPREPVSGWRRLVDRVPSHPNILTVVLGSPGGPAVPLADVVRLWGTLLHTARSWVRFVHFGPVLLPEGSVSLGQELADAVQQQVVLYAGMPTEEGGAPGAAVVRGLREDGSPGWLPFASELVYAPTAEGAVPRPPVLAGLRVPLAGVPVLGPGLYEYTADAVLEVVQCGLWIRPMAEPVNGDDVRRLPAGPGRPVILYDRGSAQGAERMHALAQDLLWRLDPLSRSAFRIAAADASGLAATAGDEEGWSLPGSTVPGSTAGSTAESAADSWRTVLAARAAYRRPAHEAVWSTPATRTAVAAPVAASPTEEVSEQQLGTVTEAPSARVAAYPATDDAPSGRTAAGTAQRQEAAPPAPSLTAGPEALPPTWSEPEPQERTRTESDQAEEPVVAAGEPSPGMAVAGLPAPLAVPERAEAARPATPPRPPQPEPPQADPVSPGPPPAPFPAFPATSNGRPDGAPGEPAPPALPEPPASSAPDFPAAPPLPLQPSPLSPPLPVSALQAALPPAEPTGPTPTLVPRAMLAIGAEPPAAPGQVAGPVPGALLGPGLGAGIGGGTPPPALISTPAPPAPAEPSPSPSAPPNVAPEPAPLPLASLGIPSIRMESDAPAPEPAPPAAPKPPATAPSPADPAAAPAVTPASAVRAGAARVQPVPKGAACAVPPARGIDKEREWVRRTFSSQYNAIAGTVSRVMSESPGLRGVSRAVAADALTDLVAVRLYLSGESAAVDAAVRGATVGSHVPLARCVASGLRRLPSFRGTALLRARISPTERAWYREGRLATEWAFCTARTEGHPAPQGGTDFLIWSMTARRTNLLDPTVPDRVLFLPGTAFKVLRAAGDDGDRPLVLLRELSASEIAEDGRVDVQRVPLDEIALESLERSIASAILDDGPRAADGTAAPVAAPPGLLLAPTEGAKS